MDVHGNAPNPHDDDLGEGGERGGREEMRERGEGEGREGRGERGEGERERERGRGEGERGERERKIKALPWIVIKGLALCLHFNWFRQCLNIHHVARNATNL